jgi:glycosyltransferase involved in cell wall biosynthesis
MEDRIVLRWFAWQPTGYNDVLFRALSADPEIDLHVFFRHRVKATHPWQKPLQQGYSSEIYRGSGARLDPRVLRQIWREDAWFVTAGWPGVTMKLGLLEMVAKRKPFLFWTDTPQLEVPANGGVKSMRPVEFSSENQPYPFWHARLRRLLYGLVFRNARAVMSTGGPGTRALQLLGCPADKIVSLPFFVELPNLATRTPASASGIFQFVASGQLVHRKGYDVAVEALGEVARRLMKPFEFLIAGSGVERAALEAQAKQLGIGDRVRILGWQEPEQVKELLLKGHCFLHPARFDPFPVAVLEAMASGLPILGSSAAGSVVDRVRDGNNGFVHAKGDVASLATHMLTVLESPENTHRMGLAARATAEEWPPSRAVEIIKGICRRTPGT